MGILLAKLKTGLVRLGKLRRRLLSRRTPASHQRWRKLWWQLLWLQQRRQQLVAPLLLRHHQRQWRTVVVEACRQKAQQTLEERRQLLRRFGLGALQSSPARRRQWRRLERSVARTFAAFGRAVQELGRVSGNRWRLDRRLLHRALQKFLPNPVQQLPTSRRTAGKAPRRYRRGHPARPTHRSSHRSAPQPTATRQPTGPTQQPRQSRQLRKFPQKTPPIPQPRKTGPAESSPRRPRRPRPAKFAGAARSRGRPRRR